MNDNQNLTESEESTKQKLKEISEILVKVIAPKTSISRRRKSFRQTIIIIINFWYEPLLVAFKEADYWEKRFLIGIAYFMILFLGCAVKINVVKTSNQIPDAKLIILMVLCCFFIFTSFLAFLALKARRTLKTPNLYTCDKLKEFMDEAVTDQSTIKDLCARSDKQTLKYAEIKILFLIETIQVQEKNNSNFLPILALGLVVLVIYIVGIPPQFLEGNKLLQGAITGLPGIVALILLILKLTTESSLQSQIIKYKRCVSLLQGAQDLIISNENLI